MKNAAWLLSLCLALPAFANTAADKSATTPDPKMEAWQKFMTPGEDHKILKDLSGKWKYTSKMWQAPGTEAMESKGTANAKLIMGGRFVETEFKGKAMGQPFTGRGTLGFNNAKKVYESTWIDTMSTGIMMASGGTYDAATKTLTEKGMMMDPMDNKEKPYRAETKFVSKNSYTFTMYDTGPDGKEFKSMEIVYTR